MAILYKSNIDLGGLSLIRASLYPASTAPTTGLAEGQVYWNTSDKKLYAYDDDNDLWLDVSGDIHSISSGGGLSVTNGSGGDVTISLAHLGIESLSDPNADRILFWDDSASASAWLSVNTTSGIKITTTTLELSAIPNSSLANSTIGVIGGAGIENIDFATPLGQSVTINVGAGTGITVNANDVELKNAGNLTDTALTMWDDTAGQLVSTVITQDATTNAITVSDDLIVTGDLTVQGSLTSIETTNTAIKDNVIVLNNGEAGAGVSSGTSGIEIDRGTETNVSLLWNETGDYWSIGGYMRIENVDTASSVISSTQVLVQATTSGQVVQRASVSAIGAALGVGGHSILLHSTQRDHVSLTGNTYTVTHSLNTKYVVVQVVDATTFETVMVEVARPTNDTVTVTFAATPTDGDYICITSAVGNLDEANGLAT